MARRTTTSRSAKPGAEVSGGAAGQTSGLAAEIGKKRPFDLPEQETHLNLLRTHSVLAAEGHRLLKPYKLSEALYNTLRILRGHDDGATPKACSDIGAMMIAQVPDVTRIIDRLEDMGLAQRRRTDADRRVVLVSITKKGLELLGRLDRPVLEMHKQQLGHMTRAELRELSRLLEKARLGGGPSKR